MTDVEPAAAAPAPETRTGSGRGWWLALVASLVLLAVLLAGVVHYLGRQHDRRARDDQRQAAMAAARSEAVALTTISYRTADSDVGRILAGATGALHAQFQAERAQFPKTLQSTKSVSKGVSLTSALASLTGSQAKVLVAVDATVTGTDTGASGVLKHYRMVVTLQHLGGRWLASDVSFAGVPQ